MIDVDWSQEDETPFRYAHAKIQTQVVGNGPGDDDDDYVLRPLLCTR